MKACPRRQAINQLWSTKGFKIALYKLLCTADTTSPMSGTTAWGRGWSKGTKHSEAQLEHAFFANKQGKEKQIRKKRDSNIRNKHWLGTLSRCFISSKRRVLTGKVSCQSKSVALQTAELRRTGKPYGHGSWVQTDAPKAQCCAGSGVLLCRPSYPQCILTGAIPALQRKSL